MTRNTDEMTFQTMHSDINNLKLLSALGNVCMHLAMLTDAVTDLVDEMRNGNTHTESMTEAVGDISDQLHDQRKNPLETSASLGTCMRVIAEALAAFHDGDAEVPITGTVQITNDNLDNLERIADDLSTSDGFSVASALDKIGDAVERTCNPNDDSRLKVSIDGEIASHSF